MLDSLVNDMEYLVKDQYRTSKNLDTRISFHERFGKVNWQNWVYDRIHLIGNVLEVGCGTGKLWSENTERKPVGVTLTLTDISEGMLNEAQENIAFPATFKQADVTDLPFPDGNFNYVIANHVLYHVNDKDKALSEIKRVLKPCGTLYTTTNGLDHMRELRQIVKDFNVSFMPDTADTGAIKFGTHNGHWLLKKHFTGITLRYFDSELVVTDTEALVDWYRSWATKLMGSEIDNFATYVRSLPLPTTVTQQSGLFQCNNNE